MLAAAFAARPAMSTRVGRAGRGLHTDSVDHDVISFKEQRRVYLPPDKQAVYCFRNKVDCIDYQYTVESEELGGPAESILVFVALRDDIKGGAMNGSVCRESSCTKSNIEVSNELKYCVVLANAEYTEPLFTNASSRPVEVIIKIKGCPTTTHIAILVAVPLAVVVVVALCLSFCWVRRRRQVSEMGQGRSATNQRGHEGRQDPQMIVNPLHQPRSNGSQHNIVVTATPYMMPGTNVQSTGYPVHLSKV